MSSVRRLRARAVRPFARRRFPDGDPPRQAATVAAAKALWRSPAFAAPAHHDRSSRLNGEDVLEAARVGDVVETRRLVETWIEAHPPHDGDAWHPSPLSTRVGNWIAALTLQPELASPELSRSLWHQLRRLRVNVEDDVGGSHVISNARALVLGGVSFGEAGLSRHGIALLRRELPEQVLRDGGHCERSPARHLFVLRDLLEVQSASPHSWLADAIDRMREFAAALARPDGAPALFGDGTADAPQLELPGPTPGLAVLAESGYVVARDDELWLAFRCGAPPPAYLPADAHADALSFQLWWRGRPVIVDPGDRVRATHAHSTVCLDGHDQFPLRGRARPKVALRYARDRAVEASVVLPGRVRHVRRIEWDPEDGGVLVRDTLEGKGNRLVESRLVLARDPPPLSLTADGLGAVRVERGYVSELPGERLETVVNLISARVELPASFGFRIELA